MGTRFGVLGESDLDQGQQQQLGLDQGWHQTVCSKRQPPGGNPDALWEQGAAA